MLGAGGGCMFEHMLSLACVCVVLDYIPNPREEEKGREQSIKQIK